MLNFFKTKPKPGEEILLELDGMHCSACALNIDGAVEELPGVFESNTSYAKQVTKVRFDGSKVSKDQMKQVIEGLGYRVK